MLKLLSGKCPKISCLIYCSSYLPKFKFRIQSQDTQNNMIFAFAINPGSPTSVVFWEHCLVSFSFLSHFTTNISYLPYALKLHTSPQSIFRRKASFILFRKRKCSFPLNPTVSGNQPLSAFLCPISLEEVPFLPPKLWPPSLFRDLTFLANACIFCLL